MFNSPMFIKKHGLLVAPNAIDTPITLNASIEKKLEVVRDDVIFSSAVVRVKTTLIVEVYATIAVLAEAMIQKATSAKEFNDSYQAMMIEEFLASSIEDDDDNVSVKKKKKRRSRDDEEEEEESVTDKKQAEALRHVQQNRPVHAFDVILTRTVIEDGNPIDLRETEIYNRMSKNSDAEEVLEKSLAKLASRVRRRGEALNTLHNGGIPTQQQDSLSALVPGNLGLPSDAEKVDAEGLRNYEGKLREQIDGYEDAISKQYESIQTKILDRGSARRNFRVTNDFVVKNTTISIAQAMEELFKEIVPVSVKTDFSL